MSNSATPTAAVLVIGNEILSGRTSDANLNMIAKKLMSIGIKLSEARVIADIESDIVKAVNELRAKYTYVFTTGGIGATHDDITASSVAKAFGMAVIEHPEARARLAAHYTPANLNAARLRMALTPQGATLIDNPVSVAPGFKIENVYVLVGVPDIAKAMMDNVAAHIHHGPQIHSITINASIPENTVADELTKISQDFSTLDIGSYPWFRQGQYGTALVVHGTDKALVKKAADAIFALVEKNNGKPKYEA